MAQDTKDQIIRAAEVLFARDGYANTSLRQITDMAGANVAAVNYHFGSKENLMIELLDRLIAPINVRRLELLDLADSGGTSEVADVLAAFLRPDLEVIEELRARDPLLPHFVSRMYSEGSELMARVVGRQFAQTQRRFYAAFQRALPDLAPEDIAWRLHCVVGMVVYLFATVEAPGMPLMLSGDVDADLRRLLDVTVPLMSAPAGEVVGSTG